MNNSDLIGVSLANCLLIFFIFLSKRPSVTFIYLNYLKVKGLPESICTFKLCLYFHSNNLSRSVQFMAWEDSSVRKVFAIQDGVLEFGDHHKHKFWAEQIYSCKGSLAHPSFLERWRRFEEIS